jgi:hypothetical protein
LIYVVDASDEGRIEECNEVVQVSHWQQRTSEN